MNQLIAIALLITFWPLTLLYLLYLAIYYAFQKKFPSHLSTETPKDPMESEATKILQSKKNTEGSVAPDTLMLPLDINRDKATGLFNSIVLNNREFFADEFLDLVDGKIEMAALSLDSLGEPLTVKRISESSQVGDEIVRTRWHILKKRKYRSPIEAITQN